jgi:hypothetical protein
MFCCIYLPKMLLETISLISDVRGQHVGEVGVQDDRRVSPLVITSLRTVQVGFSQSYVVNSPFPLGYERTKKGTGSQCVPNRGPRTPQ